jgi:U4/U6 small nuclear ribonucleoprotein PRP31
MIDLSDILPAAIIMIVSVTASTTEGTPIDDEQMRRVIEACDEMLALEQDRIRILTYVEGRMDIVAPNLSAITGSSIAARLMGIAGGLVALSRLPANVVQLLGNKRKVSTGLSAGGIHAGLINECDLVQQAPSALQMKVCIPCLAFLLLSFRRLTSASLPLCASMQVRRLVATKCTLCARVDAFHEAAHGEVGRRFREDIERKIDKWQEPPAPKAPKPLPAPDDQPRKKRGGKRARKQKEKFGVTELRKQANRMAFGVEAEETLGNTGRGLGLIGKGTGKVRLSAEQKGSMPRPKRARISGTHPRDARHRHPQPHLRLCSLSVPVRRLYDVCVRACAVCVCVCVCAGAASTIPGTATGLASSLAFTPVQGLELRVAQTQATSSEKYFSSTSGFAKVTNNNNSNSNKSS